MGLNGLELLEIIRERFNIPVIMVSGQGDVQTMSDALDMGADDFLKKPFHTSELLARVKAKLRRIS